MTKLTFLAGNNYPDLPHSQGGMKFTTQISPLLNLRQTRHKAVTKDAQKSRMDFCPMIPLYCFVFIQHTHTHTHTHFFVLLFPIITNAIVC